jgi:PKD repeat protein
MPIGVSSQKINMTKYLKGFHLLLALTCFLGVIGQEQKKVLFLGNSYTGNNNLPMLVYQACASTGDTIIYDAYTPGGKRLLEHAVDLTTLGKISSQEWDYVSLQAQSVEPSLDSALLYNEVFPFAKILCDSIKSIGKCSQPLFFMTWGRKNGFSSPDCNRYPWICAYEGMDSALRVSYTFMAETNNVELSPVGAVWNYIRDHYPSINLYAGDESHPSSGGSYAAACTFYTMILRKDPSQITWNSTLSASDADSIKMAAKRVAFDSLRNWDFSELNPDAKFSFALNGNEASFTNESQFSDSISWDFGDGDTSFDMEPKHNYVNPGTYLVTLTAVNCNRSDTSSMNVNLKTTSIIDIQKSQPFISFPNPTSEKVHIETDEKILNFRYVILDNSGKEVVGQTFVNASKADIDISFLQNGFYYLKLGIDDSSYFIKIIKH